MQLPHAVRYALEALVYLAGRPPEATVPSHVIAKERGAPEKYLLKILNPLADGGVLRSVKGPNGGYRLAKPQAATPAAGAKKPRRAGHAGVSQQTAGRSLSAWAGRPYEPVEPMAVPTLVNVLLAFLPSVVMAVMHTTMIRASMTAYSTAVGPSSRFTNSTAN